MMIVKSMQECKFIIMMRRHFAGATLSVEYFNFCYSYITFQCCVSFTVAVSSFTQLYFACGTAILSHSTRIAINLFWIHRPQESFNAMLNNEEVDWVWHKQFIDSSWWNNWIVSHLSTQERLVCKLVGNNSDTHWTYETGGELQKCIDEFTYVRLVVEVKHLKKCFKT